MHYSLDTSIGFSIAYLVDSAIQLLNNWGKQERGAYCNFTVYNNKVNNDHYQFVRMTMQLWTFLKLPQSNPMNLSEYSRA